MFIHLVLAFQYSISCHRCIKNNLKKEHLLRIDFIDKPSKSCLCWYMRHTNAYKMQAYKRTQF